MTDITSRKLLVLKGVLFLVIVLMALLLLLLQSPTLTTLLGAGVLMWASARFYYFLFYVLERHVDPRLRYAGIWALCVAIWRTSRQGRGG